MAAMTAAAQLQEAAKIALPGSAPRRSSRKRAPRPSTLASKDGARAAQGRAGSSPCDASQRTCRVASFHSIDATPAGASDDLTAPEAADSAQASPNVSHFSLTRRSLAFKPTGSPDQTLQDVADRFPQAPHAAIGSTSSCASCEETVRNLFVDRISAVVWSFCSNLFANVCASRHPWSNVAR